MRGGDIGKCFGTILRRHRLLKGLTQEGLADLANLHPTYVGLIERGAKNPTLQVCQQLSCGLDCSLSDLIVEAEELALEKAERS